MKKNNLLLLTVVAVGLILATWFLFGQGNNPDATAYTRVEEFVEPEESVFEVEVLKQGVEAPLQRGSVPGKVDLPETVAEEPLTPPGTDKPAQEERANGAIEVTVLDATGLPVVGALVRASNIAESMPRRSLGERRKMKGTTDEGGVAWLTELPLGLLRVVVRLKGFAPSTTGIVTLISADPSAKVEIVLLEGGAAEGLLRQLDGAPAEGIQVSIHLKAWADALDERRPSVMQAVYTAPDGTFRFEHLTPGEYALYTHPKAERSLSVPKQSVKVQILEGQTTQVPFKDSAGSYVLLTGVILRNGKPFPRAHLSLGWAERSRGYLGKNTNTDEFGRFNIILDEGGDYRFGITGGSGSVFRNVHVPSTPRHEVEIAFDTGSISGHLLGPQGEPIAGIEIVALGRSKSPEANSTVASVKSDSKGAYEFDHLPCATYSLSAMALDYSPDPLPPAAYPYARERKVSRLRLGPGEQLVDVEIHLREAAAIGGMVTDSEGNPALAAVIHCRSKNLRSFYHTDWKVDHKGHFLIGGLKKGEYLVRAVQQRQVSDWVTVSTQLNETFRANLTLEAGTMLNVTVKADGKPVSKCYVRINDSAGRIVDSSILNDGSTRLGPIYPGVYTVSASTKGENKLKGSLPIQLSGDPSASLELTLQ